MRCCLLLFCLLCYLSATAQSGKPFVKNYSPKVYKAATQNWAITQDGRGMLYVANDLGVLEYDGSNWSLIPTTNSSPVRSLACDARGTIFVGASGELGYLAPDSKGQLSYVSLKHLIDIQFEDVWSTQAMPDGVYFQTDKFVFFYNPISKQKKLLPALGGTSFFLTFKLGNRLLVHSTEVGLMELRNGIAQKLPQAAQLAGERVYAVLPYRDDKLLIGTRKRGLLVYDERKAKTDANCLAPLNDTLQRYLLKAQLYCGLAIPKAQYVLGTRQGGAVIIDTTGKILSILDEKKDIADHNIRAIYFSRDNLLWLGLNNGIAQVNWHLPIHHFDESSGLPGIVRAIIHHHDKIYAATSAGVFYQAGDSFARVNGINTESWDFALIPQQGKNNLNNTQLWVATNDGVYRVDDTQAILLRDTRPMAALSLLPYHREAGAWVGMKGGLGLLTRDTLWQRVPELDAEIYDIVPNGNEGLWLCTFIQGVWQANFDKAKPTKLHLSIYNTAHGLPNARGIRVINTPDGLRFGTSKGIYYFDKTRKKFVPDSKFNPPNTARRLPSVSVSVDDEYVLEGKKYWLAGSDNEMQSIGCWQRQGSRWVWNDSIFGRLPSFRDITLYAEYNTVWIGGSEGIFAYDAYTKRLPSQPFETLIRRVTLNEDSIVYQGYMPSGAAIPRFSYKPRLNLAFVFAATFYDDEASTQYRYALQTSHSDTPPEANWSTWTNDPTKEYLNLREGTYTLWVQARNVYGELGSFARYKFFISPPWYRTWWAYSLYAVGAVLLLYLALEWYTRRLNRQKLRLEKIVERRTAEIRQKNEEITIQNHEILQQSAKLQIAAQEILRQKEEIELINNDLNHSINYASRIQRAMLPPISRITDAFPDSFVMYHPRNVVSGDFYWYAETPLEPRYNKFAHIKNGTVSVFDGFYEGKKIIAAVDCTGHGVPGAFVSMMGDAYLNQIVNIEGITQPQIILKELDRYVSNALRQSEHDVIDGMDMALVVFNPNNNTLEYAGAKNPLVYIQNGEIHTIKGDNHGISGVSWDDTPKEFTRHIININVPTSIYLFSDGFEDQFGSEKRKKFMTKRMREMFLAHHHLSMAQQHQIYEDTLRNWMQGHEQVDDILLIGIHIRPVS